VSKALERSKAHKCNSNPFLVASVRSLLATYPSWKPNPIFTKICPRIKSWKEKILKSFAYIAGNRYWPVRCTLRRNLSFFQNRSNCSGQKKLSGTTEVHKHIWYRSFVSKMCICFVSKIYLQDQGSFVFQSL